MGQTEAVYAEGIFTLSVNVAKQCAKLKVARLVEISSGQMYNTDKVRFKCCLVFGVEAKRGAKFRYSTRNASRNRRNAVYLSYGAVCNMKSI